MERKKRKQGMEKEKWNKKKKNSKIGTEKEKRGIKNKSKSRNGKFIYHFLNKNE